MKKTTHVITVLTTKLQALAESKRIFAWVVLLSFLESTIVPLPLEAILIPIMYSCRHRIWRFASAALTGCMAGAVLGYGLGRLFFDDLAEKLSQYFGTPAQLNEVMQHIQEDGFTYVFAIGVTPVPFQLAMLAAGAVQYSFILFLIATLLARGLRYFGLAGLIKYFGPAATDIIKDYKYQVVSLLSISFLLFFTIQFIAW